jgi:glycosyltransferase involved in cell wall biosynthesis
VKNIKISIITTCLNSEKTIAYTLNSVFGQTYKKYIEHIIIDGGSTDFTNDIIEKYKFKNKKIIISKNLSIYESLNLGIKISTGDYILILNSDDVLNDSKVIKKVVEIIKKNKEKIYLGDVIYFNSNLFEKITRFYSPRNFKNWLFIFGHMPPHPGAFIHNSIAKNNLYNGKYKIAADYDFFLRILKIKKIPFKIINTVVTRMKTGGISGKNLLAHFISTSEINNSLKKNNVLSNYIFVNLRYLIKIFQLFFIECKVQKIKLHNHFKNLIYHDFKIIKNIKSIDFKNNFVLSALNLAFLGSYSSGKVKVYKDLIHWPDGLFAKKFDKSLQKIPGRELLNKIKIPRNIKKIIVLGNLPLRSLEFLKKRFKKKIVNLNLPYGDIKNIVKKTSIKIKKNEIVMITLPTPKQEQLAEHLISYNKNYKIICIGGSINIASGIEKPVPNLLYQLEFLWRLKYEPRRRLIRLLNTFIHYLIGKFIYKSFKDLKIKVIK